MREIKFRAWNGEQMVSPDYVGRDGRAYWKEDSIPTSSDKLMQYTGLKDKNGKEIYEGDVVQVAGKNKYRVEYCVSSEYEYELRAAMFILRANINGVGCGFPFDEFAIPNCVVIGNIYENEDLLK